jgi:NhaA family Na+:H+ antiporter
MRSVSSVTRLPRAVARPMQEFLQTEVAGGAVLLAASIAALAWANLPDDSYADVWGRTLDLGVGRLYLDLTLGEWISEGLMTLFFFVVGLEIKRELVRGELADRRTAALPVAAAIGGMALPAAIYAALNAGGDGARGWGIPMATDIAFSIGLLALAGSRVPLALKVFLLALAIVDDLGAIAVIAIFYTDDVALEWLVAALAVLTAAAAASRTQFPWRVVLPVAMLVCWLALHEAGVHATIAGAALGLLTPAGAHSATDEASNLTRLEDILHPWVSYLIVPLFALASAGVALSGGAVGDAASSRVTWGVVLGLAVGKPLGILGASYAAMRLGLATLPRGTSWPQIGAVGVVAGVGFTVSIFIAELAFGGRALVVEAKIGILASSAAMGALGLAMLRFVSGPPQAAADSVGNGDPDFP